MWRRVHRLDPSKTTVASPKRRYTRMSHMVHIQKGSASVRLRVLVPIRQQGRYTSGNLPQTTSIESTYQLHQCMSIPLCMLCDALQKLHVIENRCVDPAYLMHRPFGTAHLSWSNKLLISGQPLQAYFAVDVTAGLGYINVRVSTSTLFSAAGQIPSVWVYAMVASLWLCLDGCLVPRRDKRRPLVACQTLPSHALFTIPLAALRAAGPPSLCFLAAQLSFSRCVGVIWAVCGSMQSRQASCCPLYCSYMQVVVGQLVCDRAVVRSDPVRKGTTHQHAFAA